MANPCKKRTVSEVGMLVRIHASAKMPAQNCSGPLSVCLCLCLLLSCVVGRAGLERNSSSHNDPNEPTLVLVQMFFRHGDRSPVKSYPKNPNNDTLWPQGFGQLTQTGMRQAFEFGQELRKRYGNFLPADYERSQVLVRSTDYDRTLMTVESLLVGLFPTNMTDWIPGAWQPIPIHTQAEEFDQLFAQAPCPRIMNQSTRWTDSRPAAAQHIPQFQNLCKMLTTANSTGMEITLDNLSVLADTIFCEARHNFSRPPWLTDDVYAQLMLFRNESTQFFLLDPETARLAGGPLLAEMTKNMEERQNDTSSTSVKLFLYSAHDSTVMSLGRVMGRFNNLQPPYLTSIIVELHRKHGQFFVRTLFDNHTADSPYELTIPGCKELCPLEQFRKLLNHMMLPASDREAACALTVSKNSMIYSILVSIILVLVVVVAVMIFIVIRTRRKSRETSSMLRYKKLLQGDNADDDTDEDDDVHEL